MANWLVLGLGNPLSGADAFGPLVVERLRDAAPIPGVSLTDAGTDVLDWISRFGEYDRVVLVDAVAVDDVADAPGPLPCVEAVGEDVFSQWDARSPGAHEISPLVAVRLFRTLQRRERPGAKNPTILLVGLFVAEAHVAEPPPDAEIAAGVRAVRHIVEHTG